MNNLVKYITQFTHLRRAPNLGGAPHKPILLLSIMDGVEKGYITKERIYITAELIALFKSNWYIWVKTAHTMNFALPFFHLSNEPFWKLIEKAGHQIPLTSKKSIKSFQALIQSVDYAVINYDLFHYINQTYTRELLRKTIIDKYFPEVHPLGDSNTYYLNEIAQQILNDSAIQYKKIIKKIEEENKENLEEEIFLRNKIFQKKIPEIYNYTCSITGLRIIPDNNHNMIDACHIIPFSVDHDDTIGNGIALCPNLHRAFDCGLITIDENYKIIVSKQFFENSENTHSIRQFDNKKIKLPDNELFYPRKEVLMWHNENVFEKI